MIRNFLLAVFSVLCYSATAQDYSNRGLMEIKEQSEALRIAWTKAFDAALQSKDFSSLSGPRKAAERYIDTHLKGMRQLFAQGDGRALLTAVSNYLQIERQFVKDAMLPAETLRADDEAGAERVSQKIADFGQKERIFLVEINNALSTEGMDAGSPGGGIDPEMMEDDEEEAFVEPRGSVIEGRPRKSRGKLPHEMPQKRKKQKSAPVEEDEEE